MLKENNFIGVKVGDRVYDYWSSEELIVVDRTAINFTVARLDGSCKRIYNFDNDYEIDLVFNYMECWNKGGET